MKKFLFIAVAMIGVFFASSCSQDERINEQSMNKQNFVRPVNKTLQDLKTLNETLVMNSDDTRSWGWWNNNKRQIGRILYSDLGGAIAALNDNLALVTVCGGMIAKGGTPGAYIGGGIIAGIAVYGAAPASYKSYKSQYTCALSSTALPELYSQTSSYCKNQLINKAEEGPLKDNINRRIVIPDSMAYLLNVGIAHNDILATFDQQGDASRMITRSPILENPETAYAYSILDSEEVEESFVDAWNKAEQYTTSRHGFDFSSYIEDNPYESANVTETAKLFVNAYNQSVTDLGSLIDLVNSYIDVIESDNEFTWEERNLIYAGLIVSIYSYDLWDGILNEAE